jgi:hypothetical protein
MGMQRKWRRLCYKMTNTSGNISGWWLTQSMTAEILFLFPNRCHWNVIKPLLHWGIEMSAKVYSSTSESYPQFMDANCFATNTICIYVYVCTCICVWCVNAVICSCVCNTCLNAWIVWLEKNTAKSMLHVSLLILLGNVNSSC